VYRVFLSALVVALVVPWLFSDRIAGWAPFLLWGLAVVGVFAWLWFSEGRTRDIELGPVVFSDYVCARLSRGRPYGIMRVRLLVGQETIATRSRGLPHLFGKMIGFDYTLRAADFEVSDGVVSSRVDLTASAANALSGSRFPVEWDSSVVLSGPYRRGWLELEFFRSRTATREDVQRALIRAGAKAAET
jgi:hypothetical protein